MVNIWSIVQGFSLKWRSMPLKSIIWLRVARTWMILIIQRSIFAGCLNLHILPGPFSLWHFFRCVGGAPKHLLRGQSIRKKRLGEHWDGSTLLMFLMFFFRRPFWLWLGDSRFMWTLRGYSILVPDATHARSFHQKLQWFRKPDSTSDSVGTMQNGVGEMESFHRPDWVSWTPKPWWSAGESSQRLPKMDYMITWNQWEKFDQLCQGTWAIMCVKKDSVSLFWPNSAPYFSLADP